MTSPTAKVIAAFGKQLLLETSDGEWIRAKTAKRRLGAVCGDRVEFSSAPDGEVSVTAICKRDNLLQRNDFRGQPKPLVANIDQVIIAFAEQPPPSSAFLDRCLVGCELQGIDAVLLQTKVDLPHPGCEELIKLYTGLGYPVLKTTLEDPDTLTELRSKLVGKTSFLMGPSGVGKSSLLNALIPSAQLRVGAISEASGTGKHTTTAARLFQLPDGDGEVVDSPGIRDFSAPNQSRLSLQMCFTEIQDAAQQCRFANCQHRNEPNCAVLAAQENGSIAKSRYHNYMQLFDQLQ